MGHSRPSSIAILAICLLLLAVVQETCASFGESIWTAGSEGTMAARKPVFSRWPTGMDAVVLWNERGFAVVDSQGVRFKEVRPAEKTGRTTTSAPTQQLSQKWSLGSVVLGDHADALTYLFPNENLVLRSVADGDTLGHLPVDMSKDFVVSALSDREGLVALVERDLPLDWDRKRSEIPWTLVMGDFAEQKLTIAEPLTALVEEHSNKPGVAGYGLTGLWCLPGDRVLLQLTDVSGDARLYSYDGASGALTPVAEQATVQAFALDGALLLLADQHTGKPSVARDGQRETVVFDVGWTYGFGGAFSADGRTLVLRVTGSGSTGEDPGTMGWQVFREQGIEWCPDGPVAVLNEFDSTPWVVSSDGNVAWGQVQDSAGAQPVWYLISLDIQTGEWKKWFTAEDQETSLGEFVFKGIVLSD